MGFLSCAVLHKTFLDKYKLKIQGRNREDKVKVNFFIFSILNTIFAGIVSNGKTHANTLEFRKHDQRVSVIYMFN